MSVARGPQRHALIDRRTYGLEIEESLEYREDTTGWNGFGRIEVVGRTS
jgi:hypothetical protein